MWENAMKGYEPTAIGIRWVVSFSGKCHRRTES